MIRLRSYQEEMVQEIASEFGRSQQRVCAVAPCGAGKTVMVGWMAGGTAAKGRRVLFLVHRQELIDQSSTTFTDMGIQHGVIAAHSAKQYGSLVQVGSVQTVARRLPEMPAPDFIIIDEAHHATANTWKKIIAAYPEASVLGVTATPARLGGQGLGDVFQSLVLGPSVKELISWGNLAPYKYYAPPVRADLEGMRVKFGEFVRSEVELRMDKAELIGDLVEQYQRLAPGMRAVCYCVSRAHSEHVALSFRKAGIEALHIDGETPKEVRKQAIANFRSGQIKVLCNVDLISEGFDVPAMEATILARPTASLTLYIQQAMRSMRPDREHPEKQAIVIDHVGNVFRHGLPDEEREWSLEAVKKKRGSAGERTYSLRMCPTCYQVHKPAPTCPYCGHVYQKAEREEIPEQRKGELVHIADVERLKKRQEVGKARTIPDLERIALQRGYSLRWVQKIALAKGIIKGNEVQHAGT